MVFSSIICATRFKIYNQQGVLQQVKCFLCGGIDSFQHMLQCAGAGPIPNGDKEALEKFLISLVEAASRNAPIWPVPVYRNFIEEISLSELNPDEVSNHLCCTDTDSDKLSFDGDSDLSCKR